ncbi:MAG TPA: nuclear transport factor 2 family protein, partial [Vicinamibacterales bacterium]
ILEMTHLGAMANAIRVACFGLAFALNGCGSPASRSVAADSTALMQAYEQYRQAWLKGDTTAALALISDDIRILITGVPDIVGKDSARKLFLDEMAKYDIPMLKLAHQDVIMSGDHAIVIGRYEELQVPKAGGAPSQAVGRYMTVWRRDGDTWRIARYMLN